MLCWLRAEFASFAWTAPEFCKKYTWCQELQWGNVAALMQLSSGTKVSGKVLVDFLESLGYFGVPVVFLPLFL